jgi:hypothetical protein
MWMARARLMIHAVFVRNDPCSKLGPEIIGPSQAEYNGPDFKIGFFAIDS